MILQYMPNASRASTANACVADMLYSLPVAILSNAYAFPAGHLCERELGHQIIGGQAMGSDVLDGLTFDFHFWYGQTGNFTKLENGKPVHELGGYRPGQEIDGHLYLGRHPLPGPRDSSGARLNLHPILCGLDGGLVINGVSASDNLG